MGAENSVDQGLNATPRDMPLSTACVKKRRGRDSKTLQKPLNTAFFSEADAECGAVAPIDPILASIIETWVTLPDALTSGIVAIVKAASR